MCVEPSEDIQGQPELPAVLRDPALHPQRPSGLWDSLLCDVHATISVPRSSLSLSELAPSLGCSCPAAPEQRCSEPRRSPGEAGRLCQSQGTAMGRGGQRRNARGRPRARLPSAAERRRCPAAPRGHPPSVTGAGALRTRACAASRVSAGSVAGSSARSGGGGGEKRRRMRAKKAPGPGAAAAMAAALSNGALLGVVHGEGGPRSREIWREEGKSRAPEIWRAGGGEGHRGFLARSAAFGLLHRSAARGASGRGHA